MSKSSANKMKNLKVESQTQNLFFDAKRDMNPFWKSSLFSEVYLKNDIPREYRDIWDHDEISDETSGFYNFYNGFLNLVVKHENSSFENWKEAETVKNWIVPIMVLLGWDTDSKTQDSFYVDNESFTVTEKERKQTYRPDLLYFEKSQHKKYTQDQTIADKKIAEARDKKTGVKIVLEAKYWNRLSQKQVDSKKEKKVEDSAVSLGPDLQTLKYMEILNLDFGILTDGKTWKLFHKDMSQTVDRRNYSFELDRLRDLALELDVFGNEDKFKHYAKYFYYFFAKQSFVQGTSTTTPFVYRVFNYSKKYALQIEEDLKKRFIITMGITCNALKESCLSLGEQVDLTTIRNVAESHIFNVLFVKSCEVRHVLPIRSVDYVKVSLHEVIESLDAIRFDPDKDEDEFFSEFQHGSTFGGKKFTFEGYQIYDRFINLYEIIQDGTAVEKDFGFEIEGFKESIFSKSEWTFAKKHKINNREMIKILFTLNFIESEFSGRKFQQVPYSYFTPRQLGSIYEIFLEYRLENADTGMIFHKGQWQQANIKSNHIKNLKLVDSHVVGKGELFFSPDNEERKMSGSYYTPDYIVKYIVENTLGPILANKTSSEILNLKIIDPAMGSGHFLAGALDYLVLAYRKKWCDENHDDISETVEETSRKVLDSCIYGIDINARAVKLAQMSLWLMTAFAGKKLERLDDQFKVGNSLLDFNWEKEFSKVFKSSKGFHAVIGNPPYVRTQNIDQKIINSYKKEFKVASKGNFDLYALFVEQGVKVLNAEGRLTYILPHKFSVVDSGEPLRELLTENKLIDQFVNFNELQVFSNATTYTCLLFLSQTKKDKFSYKSVKDLDALNSIKSTEVSYANISSEKWEFGSSEASGLLKKIRAKGVELKTICPKIFQGIATSGDSIFLMDVEKEDSKFYYAKSKELQKTFKIEKGIAMPVLKGSDIKKYKLGKGAGIVIFPYRVTKDKYAPMEIAEIKKSFPEAYDYLKLNYNKLLDRSKTDKSNWWLYPYPKNITLYKEPKLIIQVLSGRSQLGLDLEGHYCFVGGGTAGGNAILLNNLSKEEILVVTGILNSDVLTYYIQKTSSAFRGGYFSYGKNSIETFPLIPLEKIDFKSKEKLVDLVGKLVKTGFDEKLHASLNDIVFNLYGINAGDIKEIESNGLEKNKKSA